MQAKLTVDTPFPEAAALWLESRIFGGNTRHRFVKSRTLKDYGQYITALTRHFGAMRVGAIQFAELRRYQIARAETCGPNKINQEVGTLVRIMKKAGAWSDELDGLYMPLQHEESEISRALTPAEQQSLLQALAGSQRWEFVYWYVLLALGTTASNCELRNLRLGDVKLAERMIYIRREGSKNKYRMRSIPLVQPDVVWAIERLLERARAAGSVSAEHYLMPLRRNRYHWDAAAPMTVSALKKPWDEVRQAAGVPWLRVHDLRHTAITRMAEAGTPLPVIMSMAGHVSRKM